MDRIVERDFDLASVMRELAYPEEGATTIFFGSVRDNAGENRVNLLHYEVYREMAEAYIRRIEEEVRKKHGARRVLVLHRVGDLEPGEKTILVASVARHREEAFAACREALERVKAEAPIWKKEVYEQGARWVRHAHDQAEVE